MDTSYHRVSLKSSDDHRFFMPSLGEFEDWIEGHGGPSAIAAKIKGLFGENIEISQSAVSNWVLRKRVPKEKRQYLEKLLPPWNGPWEWKEDKVAGMLPEHVEQAYIILCEVLDKKKKTPADGDRKAVARIIGKAARELARGEPADWVRKEVLEDAVSFLAILK